MASASKLGCQVPSARPHHLPRRSAEDATSGPTGARAIAGCGGRVRPSVTQLYSAAFVIYLIRGRVPIGCAALDIPVLRAD